MKTILIACPLPLELKFFVAKTVAQGYECTETRVGGLQVLQFPELGWRCFLAGHGKTQFGIQTQFLISHYGQLDAVICAGGAGGLAQYLKISDVVVANKTIEHDYRLKFIKKPEPAFLADEALLKRFENIELNGYQLHIGPIASGDEDIIELARARELETQTGAIAVAWEGAGGARACQFNHLPFLEIRGITDTADNSAPIDFTANLQTAMSHVAECLLKTLG